jgi:hypothetical protein
MIRREAIWLLLLVAAKFADLVDEKLKDPAQMIKSSRRYPHGRRQLTRVNSINVQEFWIGKKATTRDSGIEIGTRRTQVHVSAVEDRFILLAI